MNDQFQLPPGFVLDTPAAAPEAPFDPIAGAVAPMLAGKKPAAAPAAGPSALPPGFELLPPGFEIEPPAPSMAGMTPPLPPERPADLDTGQNVPETPATLEAQKAQVGMGGRKAVMYPTGTTLPALAPGMGRMKTPRGHFDYDPKQITPQQIKRLSKEGRENEILGLGPVSKPEADALIQQGEQPVTVVERQPDGTEVKAAVGTPSTAPAQAAALEEGKLPGSTVGLEQPLDTAWKRLAQNPPTPPARPAELGSAPEPEAPALEQPAAIPGDPQTAHIEQFLDTRPDNSWGEKRGMLTPREGQAEKAEREAGATSGIEEAGQRLVAAQERAALLANLPKGARGSQSELQRQAIEGELASAQAAFDSAQKGLEAERANPAPTMTGLTSAMSGLAKRAAEMPVGAVGGLGRPIDALLGTDIGGAADRERARTEKAFPTDKARQQDFGQEFAEGAGSMVGFIMGGAVGRAAGLTQKSTSMGIGGLQNADELYREAEKAGASGWQKAAAYIAGGAVGATEGFGSGRLLDHLAGIDKATSGGVKRYFGLVLKQKGEEGLQEAVQSLGNDLAKLGVLGIDPGDMTTNAAKNAFMGAILGGATASVLSAPTLLQRDQLGDVLSRAVPDNPQWAGDEFGRATQQGQPVEGPNLPQEDVPQAPKAPDFTNPELPTVEEMLTPELQALAEEAAGKPTESTELPAAQPAKAGGDNAPAPLTPANPQDDGENRVLRAAGYSDEDIADMSPAQRAAELEAARAEGITDPGATSPSDVIEGPAPGTRAAPVKVESEADIEPVRDTINQNPTPAQIEAGNYQKGHVRFEGLEVSLENGKGHTRKGTDSDGQAWEAVLPADYGYIKGTKGADGEGVDIFVGPKGATGTAYVIEQIDPKTGKFDEIKVITGVESAEEARAIYEGAFSDGSGPARVGGLVPMSGVDLKTWLIDKKGGRGPVPKRWRGGVEASKPGEKINTPAADPFDAAFGAGQDEADANAQKPKQIGVNFEGHPIFEKPDGLRYIETGKGATESEWTPTGETFDPAKRDFAYMTADEVKKWSPPGEPQAAPAPEFTPLAEASPGDLIEKGLELVDKGMTKTEALELAKATKRAKVVPDGRKWAVLAPPERAKDRTGRPSTRDGNGKPLTLTAFLRAQGGIKDESGELTARNLHRLHPGLVNNKRGMSLDEAREMAAEAGYLAPDGDVGELSYTEAAVATTTPSTLLDAIDNHPSYSVQDEAEVTAQEDAESSADSARRVDEVKADIRAELLDIPGTQDWMIEEPILTMAAELVVSEGADDLIAAYENAALLYYRDNIDAEESRPNEPEIEWTRIEPSPFDADEVREEAAAGADGGGNSQATAGDPENDGPGGRVRSEGDDLAVDDDTAPSQEDRPDSGNAGEVGDTAKRVRALLFNSKAFRKAVAEWRTANKGKTFDYPHPESEVAAAMLDGYEDAKAGKKPNAEHRHNKPFTPDRPTGTFNPLNGYRTGYTFGRDGVIEQELLGGNVAWLASFDDKPAEPSTEKGADNKPQLVIPGAEKIGDGKLAQMQADKPLKPKAEQKDPGGLFSDAKDELDMFADAPKPVADPFDAAFAEGQDQADGADPFADALRETQYTGNPAAKGPDGRGWRIKREDVGYIVMRMTNARGVPNTYYRPEKGGAPWSLPLAITKAQEFAAAATESGDKKPALSEPAAPKPTRVKKPKGPSRNERLRNFFRKGRVIKGSMGWDKVLEVDFEGQFGFTVTVESVDRDGRSTGGYVRHHSTVPTDREFAAWEKDNPIPGQPTKTAIAASAIKNAAGGADAALSGLSALFNSKGRPSSGFTFDEDTWKAAKPLFIEAGRKFREFAGDVAELVRRMVVDMRSNHGLTREGMEAMKPYMRRFVDDVQSGAISLDEEQGDAPGSGNDLESDSGAATAGDGLGAANVPASAGGTGPRAGSGRGPAGGRGGRGGVSANSAPVVGENGNLELPSREPEPASGPANTGEPVGSDAPGDGGLPVDERSAEDAARSAQQEANLATRVAAQAPIGLNAKVIAGDPDNIAATLPLLFPEQQDDVRRAEVRYGAGKEPGFLLTNGTGTGKTFSGLGVIARRAMQGERDILIIAPSQGILADWIKAGSLFGVEITALESTSTAGKGIVATTYANLGANRHLNDREWSLIVPDEAHKLTQGQHGDVTSALENLRAITGHPQGYFKRAQNEMRDLWDKIDAAPNNSKEKQDLYTEFNNAYLALRQTWEQQPRGNVLFMSATPFAYHYSLDYAEGYLYSFPEDKNGGYNSVSGRDEFYVENLGYRMRYNKLTKPDADVDTGVMERELHERLKREGALWGRALEVERDYDRKFVLIDDATGKQIDDTLSFLAEADDGRFRPLWDLVSEQFDYLSRMRLLEAMKARAAVPYIRKQHALGRKVVVFHDYNEGGGFNPFDLTLDPSEEVTTTKYEGGKYVTTKYKPAELYAEFLARNPNVNRLKFSDYRAPIAELTANFPNALVYNGTVPNKKRGEAKALFNTDNNQSNLIIVQSAAGEAGISLHDITNVHQRVLLNLGMPIRPTTAIQQEGRIYRVGQLSDAMFRYMNTGTNWERWTFAGKIAMRSGTAENFALGNQARTLRNSFIDAFENSDQYEPGEEGEGQGGKAFDRAMTESLSEFQKAKTHYFSQQKNAKKRDSREGVDYYATPEPLGLKMVEWANIKPNDRVLEPSAGHGAIARYFPEDAHRTLIEPSNELSSRAALKAPGARMVVDRFENLNLVNKYDAIVMNPPFGHGGKTAIDHLKKAMDHLANGGRIVALLPDGQGRKRFDDLFDSDAWPEAFGLVGIYNLPAVTFERAGTSINSFVAILEKQTDEAVRDGNQRIGSFNRDLSGAETIGEFFDRLENATAPPRLTPITPDERPAPVAETTQQDAQPNQVGAASSVRLAQTVHAKTGDDLYVASLVTRVDPAVYQNLNSIAKKHKGWYSSYSAKGAIPGFQFKSEAERTAFLAASGLRPVDTTPPRAQMDVEGPKLSQRAIDAGLSETHLVDIITGIVRTVAGSAGISVRITGRATVAGRPAYGSWEAAEKILTVALTSPSIRNTTYHEAFHALQTFGAFDERELAVMEREAPQHRAIIQRWLGAQGRAMPPGDLPVGETSAWSFGFYADSRDKGLPISHLHIGVRRAFERGFQILRRIRNYLAGLGFQTSEDIFERARAGGYRGIVDPSRSWDAPDQDARLWQQSERTRAMAAPPRIKQRDRSLMSRGSDSWMDRFVRLREWQRKFRKDAGRDPADVHRALGAINTRIAERIEDVREDELEPLLRAASTLKLDDATVQRLKAINPDIDLSDGERIVHRFTVVRHAPDYNDYIAAKNIKMQDAGSGITTQQANDELAAFQADPNYADVLAAAQHIYDMIEADLVERENAGLLSQKAGQDLRNMFSHYVPLRGFEHDDFEPGGALSGVGVSVGRKENPTGMGRKSAADSVVAQTVKMRLDGIERAQKNNVALMLFRLGQQMEAHYGAASPFKTSNKLPMGRVQSRATGQVVDVVNQDYATQDDVIVAKINGKPRYVELVGEPELADELKNAVIVKDDFTIQWIGKGTSFLGSLWTWRYPLFAPVNTVRDYLDASVAASALLGKGGLRRYHANLFSGRSLAEAVRYTIGRETPEFKRFRMAGGRMSWAKLRTLDDIDAEIAEQLNGVPMWKRPLRMVFGLLEGLNDILENAHRYALYKAGLDLGVPEAQAVKAALEGTMNFHRRGSGGAARLARTIFPFFNPSIQAPMRAKRLVEEAGGFSSRQGKAVAAGLVVKGLTKTYLAFTVMGFLVGILNYVLGGDDDDEVPFWDKAQWNPQSQKNIMIYTGRGEKGKPPGVAMIPAFPEIMAPFQIGNALAAAIFSKQKASDVAATVAKSFYNMTPAEGRSFTPALFGPIMEIINNRNHFGGPVHPSDTSTTRGVPRPERKFASTDDRWQEVARAFGAGSMGFANMHPEDYRHIARSYMGGYYQMAEYAAGLAGVSVSDKGDPLTKRFFTPGDKAHDPYERKQYDQANERANAARAEISRKLDDPTISDPRARRADRREKRDEIEAAGGMVGRNGGLNTAQTDIFQTGRTVMSTMAKRRDAEIAAAKTEPAKAEIRKSYTDKIAAERKRFRRMSEDLAAGKINADALRDTLRDARQDAKNPD